MALSNANGASTAQEVDSLKEDNHDRDEEIRQLSSLLEIKEEVAEGSGGGGGRGRGEWEISSVEVVHAKLEEEKISAEDMLRNLQVCGTRLRPCLYATTICPY